MLSKLARLLLLIPVVLGISVPRQSSSIWRASNYNSLVTFGDSYTDENRLWYFMTHGGAAPPAGTMITESYNTASGGRTWARYVVQYTGRTRNGAWNPSMTLYDYAVSGGVCSNNITPRYYGAIGQNFPSVLEYELPAFIADKSANRDGGSQPYFQPALTSTNAVYTMWIGTNDLGVGAFLTNSQVAGKTLDDYTGCVYGALDRLYNNGARVFVLFNVAPLNRAPLYAADGVTTSSYWPNKPSDLGSIAWNMNQQVTHVNWLFDITHKPSLITNRYPGASIALYNVWQLLYDIYDNPGNFLNGSAPANSHGFYSGSNPDSFLWRDELHPSEQTMRLVARNFVDVLNGNSKYAKYI